MLIVVKSPSNTPVEFTADVSVEVARPNEAKFKVLVFSIVRLAMSVSVAAVSLSKVMDIELASDEYVADANVIVVASKSSPKTID